MSAYAGDGGVNIGKEPMPPLKQDELEEGSRGVTDKGENQGAEGVTSEEATTLPPVLQSNQKNSPRRNPLAIAGNNIKVKVSLIANTIRVFAGWLIVKGVVLTRRARGPPEYGAKIEGGRFVPRTDRFSPQNYSHRTEKLNKLTSNRTAEKDRSDDSELACSS